MLRSMDEYQRECAACFAGGAGEEAGSSPPLTVMAWTGKKVRIGSFRARPEAKIQVGFCPGPEAKGRQRS